MYNNYSSFLEKVGTLLKLRRKSTGRMDRNGLATNFVREDGRCVFGGVGVYSVNEIFYIAGTYKIL